MTPKEFAKFLARDGHCYHCGISDDTLIIQHRIGRGFGGKNAKADQVANKIVLCSEINGLMESDVDAQQLAYTYGWKLGQWQEPDQERVYDLFSNKWFILDNNFGRELYNLENIA